MLTPAGPISTAIANRRMSTCIDGILNSEDKNNEAGYTPGIDAIQEFNLITQNASAEFGNYQGGIVSVSIKSGTNSFHGDVYEFFRNDALNANIASAGWTKGDQSTRPTWIQRAGHQPTNRNCVTTSSAGPSADRSSRTNCFSLPTTRASDMVNCRSRPARKLLTAQARTGEFRTALHRFGGTFNGAGVCTGASVRRGNAAYITQ